MKTITKLSVMVCAVLAACSNSGTAQNLVALQHGSTASFYTTIDAAVAAAATGDFIYIPGGVWNINNQIHVGVNFVGVGYNPDSSSATGTTRITGNGWSGIIRISSGSDNGSFTGVQFLHSVLLGGDESTGNTIVNNYSFSRCRFSGSNSGWCDNSVGLFLSWCGGALSTNLFMSENVLDTRIAGGDISNVTFVKNIFSDNGGWTIDHVQSSQFWNNIFMQTNGSEYVFHHSYNNTLANNIFLDVNDYIVYPGESNTGNIFNNNIFSAPQYSIYGSTDFNSSWAQAQNTILTNITANSFVATDDYHVLSTSPAHLGGNDGTDMGVFGTTVPFKISGVPFNPHIQSQSIGTSTDSQGHLPVNIHVAAQGN